MPIVTHEPVVYPTGALSAAAAFALTSQTVLTAWPAAVTRIGLATAPIAAHIRFIATGADNVTGECGIWTGDSKLASSAPMAFPRYRGVAGFTASTVTGNVLPQGAESSGIVSARYADTLTWTPATDATTPKGSGAKLLEHFGSQIPDVAWSPADNSGPAELLIGLYGATELLLDFKKGTATTIGAIVTLIAAG